MSMGLNPGLETTGLLGLHPCKISHGVAILGNIFAVRLSCKLPLIIWRPLIAVIDTPQLLWYFFLTPKARLPFLFSALFFLKFEAFFYRESDH
jgi:hypothetical protein